MEKSEEEETLLLKRVKSVEERYPSVEREDWVIARVEPVRVSGAVSERVPTRAVPFPKRIPESVLEPVPPTFTLRVEVAPRVLEEVKYGIWLAEPE